MSGHPYRMVVGVDLTEYAEAVLEHAFDQALRHERAVVRVVTVIPHARDEEVTRERLIASVKETLEDVVPSAKRGQLEVFVHVRCGVPEEEVVGLAEEAFASMIVVGRFGAHHRHGSVADPIVAGAGCPVLVVPPPRDTTASDAQCPDCVDVRRTSSGETWFCARHHGERLGHSIASVNSSSDASRSFW